MAARVSFALAPPAAVPSFATSAISLALVALTFFRDSSVKKFCRIGGAIDPFTSIHSIHLFVRWLDSPFVRQHFPTELLLVAWAVKGFPAGLRDYLEWSMGMEDPPVERINLEYLLWHLEMWRSVFSSTIVVEEARKRGKSKDIHIAEWYAQAPLSSVSVVYDEAKRHWDRLSGKSDVTMSDAGPLMEEEEEL